VDGVFVTNGVGSLLHAGVQKTQAAFHSTPVRVADYNATTRCHGMSVHLAAHRVQSILPIAVFATLNLLLWWSRPADFDHVELFFAQYSVVFSQAVLLAIWVGVGRASLFVKLNATAAVLVWLAVLLPTRLVDGPVASWSELTCGIHFEYSPATVALLTAPSQLLLLSLPLYVRRNRANTCRHQFSSLQMLAMVACVAWLLTGLFVVPFYDSDLAHTIVHVMMNTTFDSFLASKLTIASLPFAMIGWLALWANNAQQTAMTLGVHMVGPLFVAWAQISFLCWYHGAPLRLLPAWYYLLVFSTYAVSYGAIYATLW
jgi:hypothetical protein